MSSTAATVIARAEERARQDPEFVAVLAALLSTPTRAAGCLARAAATEVNQQRTGDALTEFKAAALTTAQVQKLLGVGTPQAVHRLRSRGKLLGEQIGNATWFPAWQFVDGKIRRELPRVIELLRRFTDDVVAADRIMRLARDDLRGRSIAEALNRPKDAEAAWSVLTELAA